MKTIILTISIDGVFNNCYIDNNSTYLLEGNESQGGDWHISNKRVTRYRMTQGTTNGFRVPFHGITISTEPGKEINMAAVKRNIHVVPNKSNGTLDWSVKREGAQRSSGNYENKTDAIAAARQIAINNKLELFEHGKNGQIQNRNSYGNDPRKSEG